MVNLIRNENYPAIRIKIFLIFSFLVILLNNPKSYSSDIKPPDSTITIATFNIEAFDKAKIKDTTTLNYIVAILRNFDLTAIQEIQSKEQTVLPMLVHCLGNDKWDFKISERLGTNNKKKQYGLIYNKSKVEVKSCFQVTDPSDVLSWEPFICYCKAGNFDFCIINVLTSPKKATSEINFLGCIVRQEMEFEKDVILLGDFNLPPDKFDELLTIDGIKIVIDHNNESTGKYGKVYDNIVINKKHTVEYVVGGGIFDFRKEFGLDDKTAAKISTHFPIYAVFRINLPDDD